MGSTCIIYSCDRQKRETCMLTTMEALLHDARRLFGYGQDDQLSVVLEREGAKITKEEILLDIAKKRDVLELMILNLDRRESWAREEVPSKLSSPHIQTISINQSQNIQIGDSNRFLQADNSRDEDDVQDVMSVQAENTEDISVITDPLRRLYALIARPKLWYELDRTARQVDRYKVLEYRGENGFNVLHAAAFHNNVNAVVTIFRHFDWAALSTQVTSGTHPGELEGCTAKEIAVKRHNKSVADRIDSFGKHESDMKPNHKIVRSRNRDELKAICTCDHNLVNITDPDNFTPLHYAAGVGFLDGVKLLLKMGADLNAVTDDGETALGRACRMGYDDVVEYLTDLPNIDIKKSVNMTSCWGDATCLDAAAEGNFRHIYDRLQRHGLPVTGNTLVCAAWGGQVELVKEIAAMDGIDVNYQNNYGNTALYLASINGHVNVVKHLINEHNADPNIQNKNGNTALHIAVLNNVGLDVVECLLDEGEADPTIVNNDGQNPAHLAASRGQAQYLDAVLRRNHERRIDPNIQDKYGDTALCLASGNGHVDVVKCLINEHKADPNIQNKDGDTALHIAVLNNVGLDVVECLLDIGGADPTILNNNGENSAHWAASSGQVQCLDAILRTHPGLMNKRGNLWERSLVYLVRGKDKGKSAWHYVLVKRKLLADFVDEASFDVAVYGKKLYSGWGKDPPDDIVKKINDKYDKCEVSAPEDLTPLHHAVLEQHPAVVEKLLELGVATDVRDAYKLTPLHLACMRGNREIVKLLVEAGADTKAADNDGDTPLDVAKLNQQDHTVDFLEKAEIVKFVRDSIQQPFKDIMGFLEHGLDTDVTADVLKTQLHDKIQQLTTGGLSCLAKLNPKEDSSNRFAKEAVAIGTDEKE